MDESLSPCLKAYDFGIISAKTRMIRVVKIVDDISIILSSLMNTFVKKIVEIDAAAIFTTLFPIRIVAKNSSGFFRIDRSSRAFLPPFFALWLRWMELRERREVSAEEKNALNKTSSTKGNI
jgi:hypothetical protein